MSRRHAFVRELGLISHRETLEVMRGADLLFLPMHDLPLGDRAGLIPYKTFEYLGARRPILAAVPDGDVRDMLRPLPNATLVRPGDVAGMTDALRRRLAAARAAGGREADADPAAAYERGRSVGRIADAARRGLRERVQSAVARRAASRKGGLTMNAGSSVRNVTQERWRQAQAWERELWVTSQHKHGWRRVAWPIVKPVLRTVGWKRAWGDDWNYWWAERFDNYRFLPEKLGDYIELGCGPYTNTRLILAGRRARRVVCSDPLAETYITFPDRWLARAHRAGEVEIDAHPIEELPFERETFDVVVMNNVLDHVRDADLCLEKATGLLRPGGIFVLGQDLSDEEDVRRHPEDIGHPIRLAREDVDRHLGGFETLLRKDLSRDEGREPRLHYGTLIFAGCKRATD